MVRFIGVRNDNRCTVGYYQPGVTTDVVVTLAVAGPVDVDDFTLTLPAAFSNGDTILLLPQQGSTLPEGWEVGTLYTLDETTTDVFTLIDPQGTLAEPETDGSGAVRVLKVTELVNSKSVAKSHEYEWGYRGFNPQQLAYDLLVQTDVLWNEEPEPVARSYTVAQENYVQFANEVTANLPHDQWEMDYREPVAWLERNITVTADFTVSSVAGNVNTTVFQFYPLVTGYNLQYIWGFGDGNGSTAKEPTHTYTTDDKRFTVTLTVRNSVQYDQRFREDYLTIGDPPTVILA